MKRWPGAAAALLLALTGLLLLPGQALAHANMAASDPTGGAALEQAPEQVRITFTEPPDPGLTSIEVTGPSGAYHRGSPELVDGDEMSVAIGLDSLDDGTYTVSWRTVSKVDGHTSAGGFAFGVGEAPDPSAQVTVEDKAGADPPGSISRWVLYLGLSAMLGAAWIALFAVPAQAPRLHKLLGYGWWASAAGVLGLGISQWLDSGAELGAFTGSSAGRATLNRALPLALTGLGILLARSKPRARWYIGGCGALVTMLVHVLSGHAAVAPNEWLKIGVQWVHFAAVGVWIGGLTALLMALGGLSGEDRLRAAKRFSFVAAIAIFVVTGTGVVRSIGELGRLAALWETSYGWLIVGKSALLVALGSLGALNRFRHVANADTSPQGLRKVGRTEVGVAVIALALAGTLANSVPPVSDAAAARQEGPVEVRGSNFARTAEAKLTVAPGNAGINRFTVELTEPSGEPIDAGSVRLGIDSLSNPQTQSSAIDLDEVDPGVYEASAPNLSSSGRYRATVMVQDGAASFEIPLEFSTKFADLIVQTSESEGQPTLYTVLDGEGRQLQLYADPENPGRSELHLTFFDADGREMQVADLVAISAYEDEPGNNLALRRFGPGHFVADLTLEQGDYLFDTVAITDDQQRLRFAVEVTISQ
ncbi:MAG: copper resistance protein CopC [Actinomycetota bacterium]